MIIMIIHDKINMEIRGIISWCLISSGYIETQEWLYLLQLTFVNHLQYITLLFFRLIDVISTWYNKGMNRNEFSE